MNDLSVYSAKMLSFVHELAESLTAEEQTALQAECRELGKDAYRKWVAENVREIVRFAKSTPKQRQDSPHRGRDRRLMILAAAQHIVWSRHLLEATRPMWNEQGYREMVKTAWDARIAVARGKSLFAWPFPSIEDPFR